MRNNISSQFAKELNNGHLEGLQEYVDNLVDECGIPALSLALWHKGSFHAAAAGVLNKATGVLAMPDATFQIGSITKVITASMVMQLVDRGLVDLDAPVKYYIKDFLVADQIVTRQVTVRQLLNHTSGLSGDFFPEDPPAGGNLIARYVDRCCLLPQVHPLGQYHSYSNAAYTIAGYLIEVILGFSWFVAVEKYVIDALSLTHTFVNPQQSLRYRSAIGHIPSLKCPQDWDVAPETYLPLSLAPAGTTLSMSASDLIKFARAHLNQMENSGNPPWLSAEAVKQMQTPSISLSPHLHRFVTDWGLGWFLIKDNRASIIGHNGSTLGQKAMLRLLPEQDIAFAALTNCSNSQVLDRVFYDLMATLAKVDFKLPKAGGHVSEPEKYSGLFETISDYIEFVTEGTDLLAILSKKNPNYWDLPERMVLKLVADQQHLQDFQSNFPTAVSFMAYSNHSDTSSMMTFLNPDMQGHHEYVKYNFRMYRRRK